MTWNDLLAQAQDLGYTVELVDYCEGPDSPGMLGQGMGVCIYSKKVIRIREALREDDRCFVLRHELDHARNDDKPREFHRALDAEHYGEDLARRQAITDYLYPDDAA